MKRPDRTPPMTMKMNTLEDRSGCTRDTIHFYLKSGLLHPPRKTGATTALYDASHLDRLIRIRTLRDAGLSLDRIPSVLASLGDVPLARLHALGLVLARATPPTPGNDANDTAGAAVEPALRAALDRALAALAPTLDLVARQIAEAVVGAFDPASPDRAARLLEVLRASVQQQIASRAATRTTDAVLSSPRRAARRRTRRDD